MYLSVPGSSSNSPVGCRTSSLKIFIAALENALTAELLRNLSFGCVNSVSSGCHTDMDFQLFQQSGRFICQELATMPQTAAASFLTLRQAGQDCEQRLLQFTGGVNTQKGLLFLVLFLWQAWVTNTSWTALSKHISNFAQDLQKDYVQMPYSRSSLSHRAGLADIRHLPLTGFRPLLNTVKLYLQSDWSDLQLTLYLIATTDDTTTFKRGGLEKLRYVQQTAGQILLLTAEEQIKAAEDLNNYYLSNNLSSGGVADLFSLTKCLAELKDQWL